MAATLEGAEDTARSAAETLAATIEAGVSEDRRQTDEFITELTDFALELLHSWPSTAPRVHVDGLLSLLIRARTAHEQDDADDLLVALVGMRTVLSRIQRQKRLARIEDPQEALALLDTSLDGWSADDIARVVGAQSRVLTNWRAGAVPRRAALERLQMVAELVVELRTVMTARGVRMWFDNPVPQLDGRSPLEVLEEGDLRAQAELLEFARGGLR